MLDELHIHGLGVIEDATLRLTPGLTVVTGETGAGKTMVVTALELLLGARADTDLVRAGAPSARIEARVSPVPAGAGDWVDPRRRRPLVSREIRAEGRSRARLQGRLAPVGALAEVLGPTVDVHAQHEHHRLTRPAVQRDLLDAYAGDPHARTLAAYRAAYRDWQDALRELADLEASARERARELDRLRFEVDEISDAAIDVDADAAIDGRIEVLEHAEDVRTGLAQAAAALGSDGAQDPLGVAVAALRRLPAHTDEITALQGACRGGGGPRGGSRDGRDGGRRGGRSRSRGARPAVRRAATQLQGLLRKYGETLADVLAYGDRAAARILELEDTIEASEGLEERVVELEQECRRLATAVHDARVVAAEALAGHVQGHLVDLAMPHARVEIEVAEREPGPDGADDVMFLLAPNPGEPARPLATAASGGERSRVALAIEVALTDVEDVDVIVFDEVDAGIGGATAMAVGEKLARLAAGGRRQVLCVTHLAQLAAYADAHHVVEKGIRDGRTVTTARQVATDDRVAELSRMLGGDTGEAARAHARELLEEARAAARADRPHTYPPSRTPGRASLPCGRVARYRRMGRCFAVRPRPLRRPRNCAAHSRIRVARLDQVHLRDRRRLLGPGQGHHRGVPRSSAEGPRAPGGAAEARPLHQRRPRAR